MHKQFTDMFPKKELCSSRTVIRKDNINSEMHIFYFPISVL